MKRRDFMKAAGLALLSAPAAARAVTSALSADDAGLLCARSGARPNVILILCDDLGWGDLGCYGQKDRARTGKPHIDTPALDAMAAEGVQFMQAYTTAPVCAPARASMVTGKNQGHCNLRSNMFDRPIDPHMTIGTVLRQAGYATWHLGKWGIGGGYEGRGTRRTAMACDAGFDYSYGYPAHLHGHSFYHYESDPDKESGSPIVENVSAAAHAAGRYAGLSASVGGVGYSRDPEGTYFRRPVSNDEIQCCYDTDLFTAKLKQLILDQQQYNATRGTRQPFFAYACYTTVHGTAAANLGKNPCGFLNHTHMHVPPAAYPALRDDDPVWGGGVTFRKDADGRLPFKGTAGTANTFVYPRYAQYPTWGQRRYATAVHHLDRAIADIRHFLKIRGLDRNTLIVFTSDNGPAGEALSSAGIDWVENGLDSNAHLRGMKRWSYEGGLREPTLACWPGVTDALAEHRTDLPMQFPAWMATLADLAGLPQPAHCDGVSVLPTLTGSGRQLPMRIYTEYFDGGSGQDFGFEQVVRDRDYVLIRNRGAGGRPELYDVVRDPSQTRDLAGDPGQAGRVAAMTALLTSCRIPPAAVPAACGAPAAYFNPAPGADALACPAVRYDGPLSVDVRLYTDGADAWPWVPNFRTLLPQARFTVPDAVALPEGLARHTAGRTAYGLSLRGWIEVPADGPVAFRAQGAGGCQLWIHEAHILEYEAGDCTAPRAATLMLAKGRHPFRLYLTTHTAAEGLCTVTAGSRRLA